MPRAAHARGHRNGSLKPSVFETAFAEFQYWASFLGWQSADTREWGEAQSNRFNEGV